MSGHKSKPNPNDEWLILQKHQLEEVKEVEMVSKRQEMDRKRLYKEQLDQMVQ